MRRIKFKFVVPILAVAYLMLSILISGAGNTEFDVLHPSEWTYVFDCYPGGDYHFDPDENGGQSPPYWYVGRHWFGYGEGEDYVYDWVKYRLYLKIPDRAKGNYLVFKVKDFCTEPEVGSIIEAHAVTLDAPLSEVTWNNQPPMGALLGTSTVTYLACEDWLEKKIYIGDYRGTVCIKARNEYVGTYGLIGHEMALWNGASFGFSGYVIFEDSTPESFDDNPPIQGAKVYAWEEGKEQATVSTTTDESGCYFFSVGSTLIGMEGDLMEGSYQISASVQSPYDYTDHEIYNCYSSWNDFNDVTITEAGHVVTKTKEINVEFPLPIVMVHGAHNPITGSGCKDDWTEAVSYLLASSIIDAKKHEGYFCFLVDNLNTLTKGYENNAERLKNYMQQRVLSYLNNLTGDNPPGLNFFVHSMGCPITRCFLQEHDDDNKYNIQNLIIFGGVNGGSYRASWHKKWYSPGSVQVMQVNNMYYNFNGPPDDAPKRKKGPHKYVDDQDVAFRYIAGVSVNAEEEPLPNDGRVYRDSVIAENGSNEEAVKGFSDSEFNMKKTKFGEKDHTPLLEVDVEHGALIRNKCVLDQALKWIGDKRIDEHADDGCLHTGSSMEELTVTTSKLEESGSLQYAGEHLDTIYANQEKSYQVLMESVAQATFSLNWWQGDLSFSLTDPEGMIIDPEVAAGRDDIDYLAENDALGFESRYYTVNNPLSGTWGLNVKGGTDLPEEGVRFYTVTSFNSTLSLETSVKNEWASLDGNIPIDAQLFDGEIPITTADMTATITKPDGTKYSLTLYDDGNHSDGAANDGNYGNIYENFGQTGEYAVVIRALTSTAERTTVGDFEVAPSIVRLQDIISDEGIDTDENDLYDYLEIEVSAEIDETGDYTLCAELKSTDGISISSATDSFPELDTGTQSLKIRFEGEEIGAFGIDGPYKVEGVRIYRVEIDRSPLIDYLETSYTTGLYEASQFEGFTGGGGGIDHHRSWYNCAIATACYGTPLAEEVKSLSAFRDEHLLTNKTGQALVRFYYKHSPRIADFIEDREFLKVILRSYLKPIVKVMQKE